MILYGIRIESIYRRQWGNTKDVQSALIKNKYSLCCKVVLTEYYKTMPDRHVYKVFDDKQGLVHVQQV